MGGKIFAVLIVIIALASAVPIISHTFLGASVTPPEDISTHGKAIDEQMSVTMEEAGIPSAVVDTSQVLLAPAGTPPDIVERLAKETRAILQKGDVREKMLKASFAVKYEGPDQLRARTAREVPMWKELVDKAGIREK